MAGERLRIVATLIRTTGDWDLAEDAVADASERALERWLDDGIPDRPAAWLTTTARRRAIDTLRRRNVERSKLAELEMNEEPTAEARTGGPIDDDRLRLIFTCSHPAALMEAWVALTLKVVSNVSTAAIAVAFLTSENTMGQRILRGRRARSPTPASRTVCPRPGTLPERLDGVLAVVYLLFTDRVFTDDGRRPRGRGDPARAVARRD